MCPQSPTLAVSCFTINAPRLPSMNGEKSLNCWDIGEDVTVEENKVASSRKKFMTNQGFTYIDTQDGVNLNVGGECSSHKLQSCLTSSNCFGSRVCHQQLSLINITKRALRHMNIWLKVTPKTKPSFVIILAHDFWLFTKRRTQFHFYLLSWIVAGRSKSWLMWIRRKLNSCSGQMKNHDRRQYVQGAVCGLPTNGCGNTTSRKPADPS